MERMLCFGFLVVLFMGWQHAVSSPVVVIEYDYNYDNSDGMMLRLHIVPAVWSDAALHCQLQGGVLATPSTSSMLQMMKAAMNDHNIARSGVFIGVTDRLSEGEFQSLDGTNLVSHLEWAEGEPDNDDDNEHCVALTSAGTLADVSCTRVLPYFCRKTINDSSATPTTEIPATGKSINNPSTEIPATEKFPRIINYEGYIEVQADAQDLEEPAPVLSNESPKCGGKAAGYEYEPRTGSCYKFHRDPLAWLPALAKCHDEGGHLAVINSEVESTVLKELFEKNPRFLIPPGCNRNYATIGLRKSEDGKWATIFGDSPADAGFDKWSPGEPNSYLGPENCGSIYRDGLLNDSSCTVKFPYICEITP